MARIFVSYSRADRPFVDDLIPLLRDVYGFENVWVDDVLIGGEVWWAEILRQIERCNIFIYLLSNDSLESTYCAAEFQEALRLQKLILPVLVRPRTDIPTEISERQYEDLSNGVKDARALNRLHRAIMNLASRIPAEALPPLEPQPVAVPPPPTDLKRKSATRGLSPSQATVAAALITGLFGLIGTLYVNGGFKFGAASAPTPPTDAPSPTTIETEISPSTPGAGETSTPTDTPPTPMFGVITRNASWEPVLKSFGTVDYMLVPAGCFMMGSTDGAAIEQPVSQQCFAQPFWIQKTEVTIGQFAFFGAKSGVASYFSGENLPREEITWFEASDFCARRGGRLPTEAEWEYAARGPDNLIYPWGNAFFGDNVVWGAEQTADAGSRPAGASWVGALDMSGNVYEWVSSIYRAYPYDTADGREAPASADSVSARVLRGGAWITSGDGATLLRAANRNWNIPQSWKYYYGFRCARDFSPDDVSP